MTSDGVSSPSSRDGASDGPARDGAASAASSAVPASPGTRVGQAGIGRVAARGAWVPGENGPGAGRGVGRALRGPGLVRPTAGTRSAGLGIRTAAPGGGTDAPDRPGGRTRTRTRGGTARDLVISMLVIVVPLLLFVAFCQPGIKDTQTFDPSGTYTRARAASPFPVRIPGALPDWKPRSASLRKNTVGRSTLRVNYLTPGDRYVQLIQSDVPAEALIPAELGAGAPRGATTIDGDRWQQYGGSRPEDRAYVLLVPGVTVIAVGDATNDEIETLIRSLS